MSLHTIQTDSANAVPWRNGGGVTRELLTWPPLSGDDWSVRISVATIDKDGPFSAFPGIQRWFAVLDGAGVQLTFGPASQTLTPGDAPLSFHGKDAPGCSLIDGSTRDLNLMSRDGRSTMQLIANNEALTAENGLMALYCVTPGIWCDNNGASQALKGHTLLWDDAVKPGVQWFFAAAAANTSQAAPVHGYWLHYSTKACA